VKAIRKSAASAQEAIMGPHPNTVIMFANLHCQDLLATVERERQAATVQAPALRIVTFATMFLGLRG
jgi:hypothetical protein